MSLPVNGRASNGEFNQIVCNNLVSGSSSSSGTISGTEYMLDLNSTSSSGIQPTSAADASAGVDLNFTAQSSTTLAAGGISIIAGDSGLAEGGGILLRAGDGGVTSGNGCDINISSGQAGDDDVSGDITLVTAPATGNGGIAGTFFISLGSNTASLTADQKVGRLQIRNDDGVQIAIKQTNANAPTVTAGAGPPTIAPGSSDACGLIQGVQGNATVQFHNRYPAGSTLFIQVSAAAINPGDVIDGPLIIDSVTTQGFTVKNQDTIFTPINVFYFVTCSGLV